MKNDSTSRFVSLAEVAEEIGAARSTVRAWLEQAEVDPYTFGDARNAKLYFKREEIEDWLASATVEDDDDDDDDADLEEDDLEEDGEEEDDDDAEDDLEEADDDAEDDDQEEDESADDEAEDCEPVGLDLSASWFGRRR
jgi:predicted DNA-binding transcriptional regulator AlpA